jgi:RND superfamily putative drug exporter
LGAVVDGWVAGIGRWCFHRRWWVLAAWLTATIAGVVAAGPVDDSLTGRAGADSLTGTAGTGGSVVGLIDGIDPDSATVWAVLAGAAADLGRLPLVEPVGPPELSPDPSAPQRTVRLTVRLTASPRRAGLAGRNRTVDAVTTRLHRLGDELRATGQGRARVRVGGDLALGRQANRVARIDHNRAVLFSLPVALILLVVVFGGLAAAGLPVLAAIASVTSTFAILLGLSSVTALDTNALTVTSLLGIGLSAYFGLLLVARYREELAAGYGPAVAVGRAWASVGRTVVFGALAVAASLAGLFALDAPPLAALGAGGVAVTLVTLAASLTLTAALLGVARHRIRPSGRAMRRRAHYGDAAEIGPFAKLSRLVQRFPAATALGTTALLLVAGVPLLTTRVRTDLPPGVASPVTGDAAAVDLLRSGLPWTVATTLLATMVLLFALTGSLVVPVRAILTNLISTTATFGLLSAVVAHGVLAGPLHTRTVAALDPAVIVIVFAVGFGLSVTHELLLLGRVAGYTDRGWDTDTAVRRGVQRTGWMLTSAALLMVIVFGCFASARTPTIEQLGLGLTVAVMIEATAARCLLVPATMILLRRWNWWAPAALTRLRPRQPRRPGRASRPGQAGVAGPATRTGAGRFAVTVEWPGRYPTYPRALFTAGPSGGGLSSTRSSTSGLGPGGSGPMVTASAAACRADGNRAGSSVRSS